MEYKGYHADVKYSDEDKLFIGEVIGLNDTLAFHGSSVSELEAMFRQSVDNYLETCQEYGKKPGRSWEEAGKKPELATQRYNSAYNSAGVSQISCKSKTNAIQYYTERR